MIERIQQRFDNLNETANRIEQSKITSTEQREAGVQYFQGPPKYITVKVTRLESAMFIQWQSSVLSLVERVFGVESSVFKRMQGISKTDASEVQRFDTLRAVFLSAKDDYEGGYLFDVKMIVHASVFTDELAQAKHFLDAGYKVPAAVIAGTVLETALRALCDQHPKLQPKDKLNAMNDDLAKESVYNAMTADQVRAWAKIRNDAAHGHPDEFQESDVNRMIDGIRDFVANYVK